MKDKIAADEAASLLDDYERFSDASQPLEEILAIRANDPKLMKPGAETKTTNNAFVNTKFYR